MVTLPHRSKSGFALVLVLLCLVLLVSITIGFFLSVTSERQAAHIDASALSVRELADSTLNVVIAQIKDGSSGYAIPATVPATTVAWASQPGLVRTFEASLISSTNPSGQYQAYKLYSSPTMVVTSSGTSVFDPQTDAPPSTWAASPALYTDLNAPLNRLDPNGSVTISGQKYSAIYPIIDPTASADYPTTGANANGVKGFSITGAPTTGTTNPAPMPVQWLYELQDGTLVAGVSSGANTVTVAGATSSNPIVARVAFWTDDDSCKVNVNTAAGDLWTPDTLTKGTEVTDSPGSYWETPRLYSNFDQTGLETNIQARNEFQRYPGHPATTYLSAVFPFLTRAQIAAIAPRIQSTGTSLGGTTTTSTVTVDSDRLYASVDELAFQQPASGATSRTLQSALTPGQIEQTRFFLTTHSRAPELNLFGGPRVAIWPVPSTAASQTIFDQTVALCSTIGSKAYYFVRSDPSSSTVDYNLGRNPTIYSYLQTEMGQTYPKFGGNFATKLGADANQLLTEIFDYIRCVNLNDSTTGATPYADGVHGTSATFGLGTVVPTVHPTNGTIGLGRFPLTTQVAINFWLQAQATGGNHGVVVPYIIMSKFCPMQGFCNMNPTFTETITGLDGFQISWDGSTFTNMGFPATASSTTYSSYWTGESLRSFGGNLGMGSEFFDASNNLLTPGSGYPFSAPAITIPTTQSGANFYFKNTKTVTIIVSKVGSTVPIQTYNLSFPTAIAPVPLWANAFAPFANRFSSGNRIYFSSSYNSGAISEADSIDSLELGGLCTYNSTAVPKTYGDYRLASIMAASSAGIPATEFAPHLLYDVWLGTRSGYRYLPTSPYPVFQADSLRSDTSSSPGATGTEMSVPNLACSTEYGAMVPAIPYQGYYNFNGQANFPPHPDFPASLSQPGVSGAQLQANGTAWTPNTSTAPGSPGDWDTGIGDAREGAYAGKADEGATGSIPYYNYNNTPVGNTNFSPNRQITSAVAFGSLPTGAARNYPWQTLLFCPNPLAGTMVDPSVTAYTSYIANHPGRLISPPDYLMLDLFTMPVVEPYAISEPFSTAGKVNLNYQIAPFNYITRSTALQAVLHSTRVTALDTSAVYVYRNNFNSYAGPNFRYPINLSETLADFALRFTNNRPFVSAAEICDMYLVPDTTGNSIETGATPTSNTHSNPVAKWWYTGGGFNASSFFPSKPASALTSTGQGFYLTGENLRQKPYGDIYPRLTTQSNSYTVHMRAQKIKMPTNIEVGSWDESVGVVEGEYRGSYSVERYIDPNDSRFVANGGSVDPDSANLNQLYKYRIVEAKKFSP